MYSIVCIARFVPLAYGIKKLQITCVVEDDKVRAGWLLDLLETYLYSLGWYGSSRRTYYSIRRSCSIRWYCLISKNIKFYLFFCITSVFGLFRVFLKWTAPERDEIKLILKERERKYPKNTTCVRILDGYSNRDETLCNEFSEFSYSTTIATIFLTFRSSTRMCK